MLAMYLRFDADVTSFVRNFELEQVTLWNQRLFHVYIDYNAFQKRIVLQANLSFKVSS